MFGGVNLTSSGNFEVQWFIHTSKIHSFTFELSSSHLESLMFTRQGQYTQRIWESSFIDVLWLLLKHIAEGFHSFIVSCLKQILGTQTWLTEKYADANKRRWLFWIHRHIWEKNLHIWLLLNCIASGSTPSLWAAWQFSLILGTNLGRQKNKLMHL